MHTLIQTSNEHEHVPVVHANPYGIGDWVQHKKCPDENSNKQYTLVQ